MFLKKQELNVESVERVTPGQCALPYLGFYNFLKVTKGILPELGPVSTCLSLTDLSRLCLMGLAETPGCATLLPASLFVSSHQGMESLASEKKIIIML